MRTFALQNHICNELDQQTQHLVNHVNLLALHMRYLPMGHKIKIVE